MSKVRRVWIAYALLLLVAFGFRFFIARHYPNDTPDDARVYAQIARNILEQHVYSDSTQSPYDPTYIRTPGYPLLVALIYSVFGHSNNAAVRTVQALIDTVTCALVAVVAFYWQPDQGSRLTTALLAFALAAVNPFTTIYAATILTEIPAIFLTVAMCLAATLAVKASSRTRRLLFWFITGLISGIGVLVRPDTGLLVVVIGLVVLVANLVRLPRLWRRMVLESAIYGISFLLVLVPWTIRNWRVFHVFQPLAPVYATMPGEFVPRGYSQWLRTWLDDQRYVDAVWWQLDSAPISIHDIPKKAFDSPEERSRVAALLEKYNHPPQAGDEESNNAINPGAAQINQNGNPASPNASPSPDTTSTDDEQNEDEEEEPDEESNTADTNVEMTAEIDAGFAQIAVEKIARHPIRYYIWLPIKRSAALWFNTHSDYYPFDGTLFPLSDLDYETHQHIWLPLFAVLVVIYSLLGVGGGFVLWTAGDLYSRLWLLLTIVMMAARITFMSTVESLEPRYVVQFFPFLAAFGGIAIGRLFTACARRLHSTGSIALP
ncbi:MAG: ArnT family glycosyltransferase [Pyrinomonadaceae bacterium]